jgi:tetratricopeptide (TPR) repeat protein
MIIGFISQHSAVCQLDAGEIKQALENSRRACDIVAMHAKPDSYIYANQVYARGISLLAARRNKEALAELTTALSIFRRTIGPSHDVTYAAQINRALALGYTGKMDEARQELDTLARRFQESKKESVSAVLHVLGVVKRLAGEYEEASRLQHSSLNSLQESARSGLDRMSILTEAGLNQLELGRYGAAISSFERALATFQSLQKRITPARADAMLGLGRARMAQGNTSEALPLLQQADRFWRDFDAGNRWAGESALWLGVCYAGLGRTAEAGLSFTRARRILSRSPMPSDSRLARLPGGD